MIIINAENSIHIFISLCVFVQVNGIPLRGESHEEVVDILKELPVSVTMVCCRPAPLMTDSQTDQPRPEDVAIDSIVQVH